MTPLLSRVVLRAQTDARLVELARAGHESAFEAIVERYRAPLERHCRRLLPASRADDALQQALVSAWSALRRGAEVRELRPWLYAIARNAVLKSLARREDRWEELHESVPGAASPLSEVELRLAMRTTLEALAALPERQRQALVGMALDGRSRQELAELLGVSDGAVRQLVHRARAAMRSAASAVLPLPLVSRAIDDARSSSPVHERMADLVTGAATSGTIAAGAAAKLAAVAVTAGAIAAGPVLVQNASSREQPAPQASWAGKSHSAPAWITPPAPAALEPLAETPASATPPSEPLALDQLPPAHTPADSPEPSAPADAPPSDIPVPVEEPIDPEAGGDAPWEKSGEPGEEEPLPEPEPEEEPPPPDEPPAGEPLSDLPGSEAAGDVPVDDEWNWPHTELEAALAP